MILKFDRPQDHYRGKEIQRYIPFLSQIGFHAKKNVNLLSITYSENVINRHDSLKKL